MYSDRILIVDELKHYAQKLCKSARTMKHCVDSPTKFLKVQHGLIK